MTIKTNEHWLDEPFDQIEAKLLIDTTLVNFGLFNFYKKGYESYPRPWIGQIKREERSFKLFRQKGSENTSDLSVVGQYTVRGTKPVVVVKHKLHFTVMLGAIGLMVAVLGLSLLLQKKSVTATPVIQAIAFAIVILYYIYTIGKDLREDEKQIEKTLARVIVREEFAEEAGTEEDHDSLSEP